MLRSNLLKITILLSSFFDPNHSFIAWQLLSHQIILLHQSIEGEEEDNVVLVRLSNCITQ